MPVNNGEIIGTGGAQVEVKCSIYYDKYFTPAGAGQPLIDGPRGYCLDLSNPYGVTATVGILDASSNEWLIDIAKGDPVASGSDPSLTAAQMAALGYHTRGDIGGMNGPFITT